MYFFSLPEMIFIRMQHNWLGSRGALPKPPNLWKFCLWILLFAFIATKNQCYLLERGNLGHRKQTMSCSKSKCSKWTEKTVSAVTVAGMALSFSHYQIPTYLHLKTISMVNATLNLSVPRHCHFSEHGGLLWSSTIWDSHQVNAFRLKDVSATICFTFAL